MRTWIMRGLCVPFAFAFVVSLAACAGHAQSGADAEAPASEAASSPGTGPAATAGSATATGGTPIPVPTPTPDPNLLSVANGTILRAYTPVQLDGMNDGNLRNAADGIGSELPADAKPPYVFTFEFVGLATITEFDARLRSAPDNEPPSTVTFAVSTTGPDSGFNDVGTATGTTPSPLPVNAVKARWVRVTANRLFDSVAAAGTIAPPSAPLQPTGIYVEQADPDKNGGFVATGAREGLKRARFTQVGSALVATECTANDVIGTFVGSLDGRQWVATNFGNKDDNPDKRRSFLNDDASIVAGVDTFGGGTYFTRTTESPAACLPRANGTGAAHQVLVLDQDPVQPFYPADRIPPLAGFTFTSIGAGMLDASMLAGKEAAITRNACNVPQLLAPEQQALLLKWVAAGHELIVGGGSCYTGSDFTWLPYPFRSAGTGAESTNAGLVQLENSALGTNDRNDAPHFVDVNAYVADTNNDLAAAAVVTTNDPHWCGHFFVAKKTNVNGFVQMYATWGNGTIVYDGFNADNANPILQKIRELELALPVGADLPCTQHVTDAFLLEPNQEAGFAAGRAAVVRVPLELLANQGWSGNVTIRTSGALRATAEPGGFTIAGGTVPITLEIEVPASTKPGVYTVDAIADNGAGKQARVSVTLTGTASLAKLVTPKQKRIRIYGIHFDVDSAVIQTRSEPVIADIAHVMHAEPGVRFQVEGHTDSDGGAAYNLALSQRRAQAVVDDLVRHGIARGRLVPRGFGLTKPVASNASAAGKALNRRVELLRL